MFAQLSENLTHVFQKLRGKGYLSEDDVTAATREVRIALLEADVALPVVKEFTAHIKDKAIGQEVIKSISPAQMVIKIVHDELIAVLGQETRELQLNAIPPVVILMVGLQGSGKTTSCAKLALQLKQKQHKKVLLASLDIYRPAAQTQLEVLARQIQVDSLPVVPHEKPLDITKRAIHEGKLTGCDVVILDTAGRLHIDDDLMHELHHVKKQALPVETLLVADALTGQDAVNIAKTFNEKIGLTGIILTRVDGDGRGGAALSMRHVTQCPVIYMGTGEKLNEFELFHPERIASRILGMGDIVSLVEKAAEQIKIEDASEMEARFRKGAFDLDDLAKQFKMMRKMGGIGGIMGLIPGLGKFKKQVDEANIDNRELIRMESIIYSMTLQERRFPKVINASRKRRIAAGAGTGVPEVNRLLKQYTQMALMVKKLGKMDKKSLLRRGFGGRMPKI